MALTIHSLPTCRMRNDRDPIDTAPRCQTQWRLSLDEAGTVDVYGRDYYGGDGTPMDEWHNLVLTWGVGQRGVILSLETDIEKSTDEIAQKVIDACWDWSLYPVGMPDAEYDEMMAEIKEQETES